MPQADATQPPPGSQPQPLDSVQPVPVEATQPRVSGQILLHVGTKDQASAAVRISDRAGSVNVSVHAADPELRNSLRSSLGELTSQLNEQGWKTDVVKTPVAPAPAQSDNKPDSGSQGNRSFSQHHHSGDNDRQPHRDRRAQPNWLDEFEQQTSSNTANSGGTN
jgi:hypothetical protein